MSSAWTRVLRARQRADGPEPRGQQPNTHAPERRTIVLIRILLGCESVIYSVVTPLLPHYAHAFTASKPAIS